MNLNIPVFYREDHDLENFGFFEKIIIQNETTLFSRLLYQTVKELKKENHLDHLLACVYSKLTIVPYAWKSARK